MKNFYKSTLCILIVGSLIISCEGIGDSLVDDRLEENPLPTPATYSAGTADFSNYVSIGNSLTAGYMDGALYTSGQSQSFPALVAAQLEAVGATSFNQPDVNSVNGFNSALSDLANGVIFGRTELDVSIPGPVPTVGEFPIPAFSGNKAALNNFGVPGIKVADLFSTDLAGVPALGLYYSRFASSPGSSTVLGDAIATDPSFFSLWIGNNDVLSYALSGGISETLITSTGDFQTNYGNALGALAQTGAKGVTLNIPPIVVLPFFRAISWNVVALDEATATALNTGLAGVNAALQGLASNALISQAEADKRKISYSAGNNPILVIDEELEDLGPKFDLLGLPTANRTALVPYEQSRPMTAGELVLLTAGAVLNTPFGGDATKPVGVVVPLGFNANGSLSGDRYYLTIAEQTNIVTARATFNAVIDGVIAATNSGAGSEVVVLVDTHPVFADLFGLNVATATQLALSAAARNADYADGVLGLSVDGVTLQPDFGPNGVFSTDAVHPNPRGNAIIANEILKTIETKFGATLPRVSVLNYPGIVIAQ